MNPFPFLISLVVFCIGFQATAGADLVAHWTGDNTANDSTANGHHGTVNGATYTTGVFGNAFSFDGVADSVVVSGDPSLEPSNLSISMWVRATPENHHRILADSSHGVGSTGWALQLNNANNLSFAYGNGGFYPEITTSALLGDNLFHHYVATLDGVSMSLYVDGNFAGSLAYSGTPAQSGGDIQLGDSSIVVNRAFQGALDDVRIFNHALSQSEVSGLFNAASVPEPGSAILIGLAMLTGLCRRR